MVESCCFVNQSLVKSKVILKINYASMIDYNYSYLWKQFIYASVTEFLKGENKLSIITVYHNSNYDKLY